MIIANIIGGLGNQMFQYAAGRALSLHRGVPLRLDISGYANYELHHGFELERIFKHTADIASDVDVRGILGWQYARRIRELLARPRFAVFRRNGLIVEPHFHYWSEFEDAPEESYLVGYWQSEKYFFKVAEMIATDFTFKLPMSARNLELAEQIKQTNAVSLHVRRGDYANNPVTTATHGLCSLEYYHAAVCHIAGKVKYPHFFIFSDDAEWVKKNLRVDFPCKYIDHNRTTESYNDMRLMSMCKHNIIANSSFSWWGAWLNENHEKIVIAPKKWFTIDNIESDLIPKSWVKI